jgi:hypothetical protein
VASYCARTSQILAGASSMELPGTPQYWPVASCSTRISLRTRARIRASILLSAEQGYGTLTVGSVICLGLWDSYEYSILLPWGDTTVEERVV